MTVLRCVATALACLVVHAFAQTAPPATAASWTPIGPNHTDYFSGFPPAPSLSSTSGRIAALAVDRAGHVYAGAAGGGLWRMDATSWTPLTDSLPWLEVASVAIDPSNDAVIYVGTGHADATPGYYGAGLYKSTDAGATWTYVVGPFLDPSNVTSAAGLAAGQNADGARILSLTVSPTDPSVVLAGVEWGTALFDNSGVYRSNDGGFNWTLVLHGNNGFKVAFNPADGSTAYADLGSSITTAASGLYRSRDGGVTWSLLAGGLPTSNLAHGGFAIAPSDPRTLYVGFGDNAALGHLIGLYKSTDAGDTWTRLDSAPDYCAPGCDQPNNVIAVHPSNRDVVIFGGTESPVKRTLDGGTSFADINGSGIDALHVDVNAIAFSPDGGTLYVGNDGGLAVGSGSTSASVAWSFPQENLAVAQFYPGFDVDRTNANHAFAGTQDNGYQVFTGDLVWRSLSGWGDAGSILYEPSTDTPFIGGWTWYPCPSSVCYTIASTSSGIPATEPMLQLPPIAADPTNPAVQYTGGQHIYQTTDAQASWAAISPMLLSSPEEFSTIAVAAHDPNVVCAGTTMGHVWCTSNALSGAAATWSRRDTGLPARYVTKLSIYRFKEYVIAASFAGFTTGSDTVGHVFLSADTGTTWSDISGNLPNTQVSEVLIDDPDISQLYAATDQGLFRTLDGGITWARVSMGLPRAIVTGLVMQRATRTLYASTFGRSIWRISAPVVSSTPPAATTLNPWRMRFSAHFGDPSPAPQSLAVINAPHQVFGATPMNWTATAMPAFGGSWLSASPAAGTDDTPVIVTVSTSGLALGRYNGMVRVFDPAASNGPQDLLVMLEITDTAPVADAGADSSVDATSPAGAIVILDGSASYDADKDPINYSWTGTFGKAAGVSPKVTLPIGTNVVTLTVSDPAGLTGTAKVTITVEGAAQQTADLLAGFTAAVAGAPHRNQVDVLIKQLQKAVTSATNNEICNGTRFFVMHEASFVGDALTQAQLAPFIAQAQQIENVAACK
jgi:photosystem II stability/assembly factor-like uncharacterized protein